MDTQYKTLAILILGMFLINFVSAEVFTFDNTLKYSDDLLKVDIINTFGLGETIGTIELKSHSSVDEIKKVGYGDYAPVMWYDFSGWDLYENGLGNVYFIDEKTGEDTEKLYYFAELKEITREIPIYNKGVGTLDKNGTLMYETNIVYENYTYQDWIKYNSKDIPETKTENRTIALMVYVEKNDYTDAIWSIAGKKIKKHASWNASFEADILAYYTIDGNHGIDQDDDYYAVYNSTDTHGPANASGIIGSAYDFEIGDGDYINYGNSFPDLRVDYTINFWVNLETCGTSNSRILNKGNTFSYQVYNAITQEMGGISVSCSTGSWDMITAVYDAGTQNMTLFLNYNEEITSAGSIAQRPSDANNFIMGNRADLTKPLDGILDEVGFWNRTLSYAEIYDIYNDKLQPEPLGGGGPTDEPPSVILNSPENYHNYTSSTATFNATITDDYIVQNVSLLIDGVIDQTNTSNHNGTYIFTKSGLSTGLHNWSILAYDNASQSNQSTTKWINITIIGPTITLYQPANNTLTSTPNQSVIVEASDDLQVQNLSVWVNGTFLIGYKAIGWPIGGTAENYTFSYPFAEGVNTWNASAYDNDSNTASSELRIITIDTINPQVLVGLPENGSNYVTNYTSTNATTIWLNWSAIDINLDKCWYDFTNGTRKEITCNSNVSLGVGLQRFNFRFYANDTLNHTSSDLRTPDYRYVYFENAHTYNPTTTETFSETFTLNITLGSGVTLNSAFFNYNGTTYNPSINTNGNQKVLRKSISIPDVSSTQNATFFWTLNSNIVNYNTSAVNQTISPLIIDNCTANTIQILNYSIYDEELRTMLPAIQNTTSKITLRLGGDVNGIEYKQYNHTTIQNPIVICINASLGAQNYRLDTEMQYKADDYVTEYHYLNNYTLNSSVTPKNISLYLIKSTDSQEFLINLKDTNLNPISGAFIEIWRQYLDIAEQFLQVEVAKTDNDGRTIGHFVLNDEVYNVYVYEKDTRDLITSYSNVRAFCVDVTTGDCQITIQEQATYDNPEDFFNYLGVIGNEKYNDNTKTYTFTFSTEDNTAKKVNLTIYKYDVYLTDVVCSSEDTATSGTFTCVIPAQYYNGSVLAEIYVNDGLYSSNLFYVSDFQEQGLNAGGFILAFLLVITLPLLALGSGPMTLIFFIVGLVLIGGLFLVNFGGFIGGFSAFLWLVLAGIILLIKASRRREQ